MALLNPYEKYRKQDVMTSGQGELLLMLYDGCIKQLKLAMYNIESGSIADANSALIKAQDIICQLITDLNMKYEVSIQLKKLYEFMVNELIIANIKKSNKKIEEVLNLITDLRDTWKIVILKERLKLLSEDGHIGFDAGG